MLSPDAASRYGVHLTPAGGLRAHSRGRGAPSRVLQTRGVGSEPTQKRKSRHLRELQAGVALHGGLPVAWGSLLRTWPSTALLLGTIVFSTWRAISHRERAEKGD